MDEEKHAPLGNEHSQKARTQSPKLQNATRVAHIHMVVLPSCYVFFYNNIHIVKSFVKKELRTGSPPVSVSELGELLASNYDTNTTQLYESQKPSGSAPQSPPWVVYT
eukprot:PhM_4_TR15973/c1_g2_i1/m.97996